jgi:hypothetical protein
VSDEAELVLEPELDPLDDPSPLVLVTSSLVDASLLDVAPTPVLVDASVAPAAESPPHAQANAAPNIARRIPPS